MAHDVFISYSSKDKPIADAVCGTLEGKKIRCWIAPRDVLPGVPYGEALVEAIEASRVMVLVLSSNSNNARQVWSEVERAFSKGIPIIPFRVEEVLPSKPLEHFISPVHWLDALTPPLEKHLQLLAETLLVLLVRQSERRHSWKGKSDPVWGRLQTQKPDADTKQKAKGKQQAGIRLRIGRFSCSFYVGVITVLLLIGSFVGLNLSYERLAYNPEVTGSGSAPPPRPDAQPPGMRKKPASGEEIQLLIKKRADEMGQVLIRTLRPDAQPGRSKSESMRVSDDGKILTVQLTVRWESRFWKQETGFAFLVGKDGLTQLEVSRDSFKSDRIDTQRLRLAESRLRDLLKSG
jgi:hypothetical protein